MTFLEPALVSPAVTSTGQLMVRSEAPVEAVVTVGVVPAKISPGDPVPEPTLIVPPRKGVVVSRKLMLLTVKAVFRSRVNVGAVVTKSLLKTTAAVLTSGMVAGVQLAVAFQVPPPARFQVAVAAPADNAAPKSSASNVRLANQREGDVEFVFMVLMIGLERDNKGRTRKFLFGRFV